MFKTVWTKILTGFTWEKETEDDWTTFDIYGTWRTWRIGSFRLGFDWFVYPQHKEFTLHLGFVTICYHYATYENFEG